MKKLLIIGLILLMGCAQTQEQKLVKSCINLCFQVLEEMNQGDKHYIERRGTHPTGYKPVFM